MIRTCAAPLALLLALGACVPQTGRTVAAPGPPIAVLTPGGGAFQVIGSSAAALVGRFGQPDLDIREGNARKLQFASPVCVLDAYLYPREGGEPAVTHVDARLPDGRDVDRASCISALMQRRQAR